MLPGIICDIYVHINMKDTSGTSNKKHKSDLLVSAKNTKLQMNSSF